MRTIWSCSRLLTELCGALSPEMFSSHDVPQQEGQSIVRDVNHMLPQLTLTPL